MHTRCTHQYLFAGCTITPVSVFSGLICSDSYTSYHTEIKAVDLTYNLTQSQYSDTGPTSPSADPITLRAWQGNHWNAIF